MLDLQTLAIFIRVAEVGSFTRAAEQLSIGKGQASLAVQTLESQVGARLLVRTTRSVRLTQEGEELRERGRELLAEAEQIETFFQPDIRPLRGTLRIDLPTELASDVILPRLPELLLQHPGLEVAVSCTDRLVDVQQEGFDCVLRVGELNDSNLMVRRLGSLPMCNVASPAYLAKHGVPQTIEALSSHRLVHYSARLSKHGAQWEWIGDKGVGHKFAMQAALIVNGTRALKSACLAGLGLIQVPHYGVRSLIESGELVEVLPQYVAPDLPVSLLYPYRRHPPMRVRVMLDWLQTVALST